MRLGNNVIDAPKLAFRSNVKSYGSRQRLGYQQVVAVFSILEMSQAILAYFFKDTPVIGTSIGVLVPGLGGLALLYAGSNQKAIRQISHSIIFPAVLIYMVTSTLSLFISAGGNDHFPVAALGLISDVILLAGIIRMTKVQPSFESVILGAGIGFSIGTIALTVFTLFNLGAYRVPFIFYAQNVMHRNAFANHGVLTALVALMALGVGPSKRTSLLLWVGCATGLLDALLAASKTVWAGMSVVILLVFMARLFYSKNRLVEFGILGAIILASTSFITFFYGHASRFLEQYQQNGAESMQDRHLLWDQAGQILSHPVALLIGSGYNSPGTTLYDHGNRIYSFHSDILNLLASGGCWAAAYCMFR